MRITWFGHSTVLLELDGVRLLTDPLLRRQVFHVRRVTPPLEPPDRIDAVLISHVHYDHLDLPTLRRLGRGTPIIAPAGAGRLLRRRGFTAVTEVSAGEEIPIGSVRVCATHADHEARRALGGTVSSVGHLVEGSSRVYLAGDTDIFAGMGELAPLDLALLPVSGWGPALPAGHMNPQSAAESLVLLRPRVAVPVHWGTYRRAGMSRDPAILRAPAEQFVEHARTIAPEVDVHVLPVGGGLALPVAALAPVAR